MNESVKRLCTDTSAASSSKQMKKDEEQTSPFKVGGKCDDEVKLVFDDKKKLHVSRNFLILSSPVFEAMFRNDFSEKRNNLVKLPGKKYEDFLEFLDCMNPGSSQDVGTCNMTRIAIMAEEYQVNLLTERCKREMTNLVLILKKELQKPGVPLFGGSISQRSQTKQLESLRNCFNVLHTAIHCCFQDLIEQCIKIAACYPSDLYERTTLDDNIHRDCIQLFNTLPAEMRYRILSKRLRYFEQNTVKEYY